MIDEFGALSNDEVKVRIDGLFTELNQTPGSRGVIINYGTPAEIRRRRALIVGHIRFRRLDLGRITFIDGPDTGAGINTKLYVVPANAADPIP